MLFAIAAYNENKTSKLKFSGLHYRCVPYMHFRKPFLFLSRKLYCPRLYNRMTRGIRQNLRNDADVSNNLY